MEGRYFPQTVHVLEEANHGKGRAGGWIPHCCWPPTNAEELLSMGDSRVAVAESDCDNVDAADVDQGEFEFAGPHRRAGGPWRVPQLYY
jgi:hypothetical protein